MDIREPYIAATKAYVFNDTLMGSLLNSLKTQFAHGFTAQNVIPAVGLLMQLIEQSTRTDPTLANHKKEYVMNALRLFLMQEIPDITIAKVDEWMIMVDSSIELAMQMYKHEWDVQTTVNCCMRLLQSCLSSK